MENLINVAEVSNILMAIEWQKKYPNYQAKAKHDERLTAIFELLPSGSGIDSGTLFDSEASNPDKLVFTFGFHHMDENGYYSGWTYHKAIIKPSLFFGFTVSITGRDRNQVKDYLHDVFANTFYIDTKYLMPKALKR